MTPNARDDQRRPVPFSTLAGVAAGSTAAQASLTCSPFYLSALISVTHYSPAQVGIFFALEMAACATAMLLLAPIIKRIELRGLALAAMLVIAAGQIASAVAGREPALIAMRVVTGLGTGVLSASMAAAAARTAAPARVYAVATATMTIVFALSFLAIAQAGKFRGPVGMFVFLGALDAALIPAMLLLPRQHYVLARSEPKSERSSWRMRVPGLLALTAMATFNYGALAIWPFTERIGEHIGLTMDRVSVLTAVGNGLAAMGGIAASYLGDRFGYFMPLLAGLAIQGLGSLAICYSSSEAGYLVTYSIYLGDWYFCYAYILAVAAVVDPVGKLAVLTAVGYPVSTGLGSLSAGFLVERYSLQSIGWLAVAGCAAAFALLLPVLRVISDRKKHTELCRLA